MCLKMIFIHPSQQRANQQQASQQQAWTCKPKTFNIHYSPIYRPTQGPKATNIWYKSTKYSLARRGNQVYK